MTGQHRPAGHDRLVMRRIGAGQLTHDPSTGIPRPPSSHLDMGPGDGYASCRLVDDADPNEVMNEGAGDYLYVLPVASIREAGMDVFETPESGGPGHCDITSAKTIRRRAKQRLMAEARWVRGHSPPGAPEDRIIDVPSPRIC